MNDARDNEIQFVDQTIRDAQQSLWGHMMTTDMILSIAPVMDRVGFKAIFLPGARGGVVQKRYLRENVFDGYRALTSHEFLVTQDR